MGSSLFALGVLMLPLRAATSLTPTFAVQDSFPVIDANRNEHPAGHLTGRVLSLRLEARTGLWFPDEADSPPLAILAFAEAGASPSIPGPLIRVRTGTRIKVSVSNPLSDTLVLHGLNSHPARTDDTAQVAPGGRREISFTAGAPGTYFYWGATATGRTLPKRSGLDSQLNGVFIVDPEGRAPHGDHIFVLGLTDLPSDTMTKKDERFLVTINGRSWPHTERFDFTEGESVRWRWINPTVEAHPMHLHGFFYRVTAQGSALADTALAPADRPLVVTQAVQSGQTMTMAWSPTRPGNWLMHCHLQVHVTADLVYPMSGHYYPVDSIVAVHGHDTMAGLVIGFTVRPRGAVTQAKETVRQHLRMIVDSLPGRLGNHSAIGVTIEEAGGGIRNTAPRVAGPPLILTRGRPTRITLVNHLTGPIAVHWHGIELESYYDGVPGWSGDAARLAPHVMPDDSFDVLMTPPRAGTFIYHTHMENENQLGDGLYGPLIVLPPGESFDSTRDIPLVLGGNELGDLGLPWLNGETVLAPLELEQSTQYRLRIINILANNGLRLWLSNGRGPVRWRPVAKDGADLPKSRQKAESAFVGTNVGETYDFAFTPKDTGDLRIEVAKPLLVSRAVHVRPAGTPAPTKPEAVVRQVDRVVIGSREPLGLFSFFADTLGFPVEQAFSGSTESGAVAVGNAALEFRGDSSAPAGKARVTGLVFRSYPIYDALLTLHHRDIGHGRALPTIREGGSDTLWMTAPLPSLSRGTAVVLRDYRAFDPQLRQMMLSDSLAARRGGLLGVGAMGEVRVGVANYPEALGNWQGVLRPFALPATGPWPIGTGPAIRLDSAATDGVQSLVFAVFSLEGLTDLLRARGWLGESSGRETRLDPARVEGLDLRFITPEE